MLILSLNLLIESLPQTGLFAGSLWVLGGVLFMVLIEKIVPHEHDDDHDHHHHHHHHHRHHGEGSQNSGVHAGMPFRRRSLGSNSGDESDQHHHRHHHHTTTTAATTESPAHSHQQISINILSSAPSNNLDTDALLADDTALESLSSSAAGTPARVFTSRTQRARSGFQGLVGRVLDWARGLFDKFAGLFGDTSKGGAAAVMSRTSFVTFCGLALHNLPGMNDAGVFFLFVGFVIAC
jgi:zinc transporter ZupT